MTEQLANAAEVRRAAYEAYEAASPFGEHAWRPSLNAAIAAAFAQAAEIMAGWAREVEL
jgi:hypothetical protein